MVEFYQQRTGSRNKRLQKTRYLKLQNLLLFFGKMQSSGLMDIIPLACTSAVWGQNPLFSHPQFPQGLLLGEAAV